MSLPTEYETIPARDMIHLFWAERPGQYRGVPEITSAIPLFAQLRRYTLAVIAAAETAADFAAVLQTQQNPEDPDDVEPLDTFDLEKRTLMTLPRGWTALQMKAEQPATTYQMFKAEILNEIARCINMPYNIAAGNSSGYNYASGRLDHQTYFRAIDIDRCDIASDALDSRILPRWWEEARMVPGILPESVRNLKTPPRHGWHWDGREHVDPVKEASAQDTRLKNNMTTYAHEFAREGRDWEEELQQRAVEKQREAELGLTVPAESPQQASASLDRIEQILLQFNDRLEELEAIR